MEAWQQKLVGLIQESLDSGMPAHLISNKLTELCNDRDAAIDLVFIVMGDFFRVCYNCSFMYGANITICPYCGDSLTPFTKREFIELAQKELTINKKRTYEQSYSSSVNHQIATPSEIDTENTYAHKITNPDKAPSKTWVWLLALFLIIGLIYLCSKTTPKITALQSEICNVSMSGSSAIISIEGSNAQSHCDELVNKNPKTGLYYYSANLTAENVVCSVKVEDVIFTVRDTNPDGFQGGYLCKYINSIKNGYYPTPSSSNQSNSPSPTDSPADATLRAYSNNLSKTQGATYATSESNYATWQACSSWDQITPSDKGRTLCVYGTVKDAYFGDDIYYLRFSDDPSAFRFIVQNNYYFKDVKGNCVKGTGKVEVYNQMPYISLGKDLFHCQ